MTRDRALAPDWLARFEGAGLDGVIAKPADGAYQPGKRAMIKVKHARTADCVVAGFRWHKSGKDAVGLAAARPLRRQRACCTTSASLRRSRWRRAGSSRRSSRRCARTRSSEHPWREWAEAPSGADAAHAGRAEPLERGQGSVVGAAAHRARVRGEVRPHAGRSLPPRRDLPALAAGQAAARTAATTSSRSRRRYELEKVFGRGLPSSRCRPDPAFLRRPQLLGHVLQIDADARPGRRAAAHRVDQHVGGLQVRSGLGMARLPALEARERSSLSLRAADLDQRMLRRRVVCDGCTRGGSPACFL